MLRKPKRDAQGSRKELDFEFLAALFHCYSYALSRALTRVMGETQAAFVSKYADNLVELLKLFGIDVPDDIERYCKTLNERGIIKDYDIRREKNSVTLIFKECALAPIIHAEGRMRGYTGDLCPLATIGMVALAKSTGWFEERSLFDCVRFAGKLSYFTEDGSETTFEIVSE